MINNKNLITIEMLPTIKNWQTQNLRIYKILISVNSHFTLSTVCQYHYYIFKLQFYSQKWRKFQYASSNCRVLGISTQESFYPVHQCVFDPSLWNVVEIIAHTKPLDLLLLNTSYWLLYSKAFCKSTILSNKIEHQIKCAAV